MVAFYIAFHQNKELIGDDGLLPLRLYLRNVNQRMGTSSKTELFSKVPTVFWWLLSADQSRDFYLDLISVAGALISFAIVVSGAANAVALFSLWILYHSIVNVGQTWYSFGWESQLLETGFLAIWTVPVLTWRQIPGWNAAVLVGCGRLSMADYQDHVRRRIDQNSW